MLWRGPHGGGAASGAAGTQVASHNTGGQYLKARTVPTNPNTIFQQEVRNAVRTTTSRWNTLTPEQRDGWGVYAANTTFRNRLGDTIKISGIANYVRSNTPRFQAGLPLIDDAPGTFDLGDVNGAVIAFDFGTADGTLTLDDASDWITNNGSANTMLVYVSRPQNAGINFFKGPYRLAGSINGTSAGATPAQVISLPFAATAGLGQQLFGQVRITRGDARLSSTFQFSGNLA
jgi:hypothetical protein